MTKQEQLDWILRLRASLEVASRRGRYYEPVPVVELKALLAAAQEARPV